MMNKKPVNKPLTEESFKKLFPELIQASFREYFPSAFREAFQEVFPSAFREAFQEIFPPAFKKAFKPAFQDVFEPYALAIQQDSSKSKERDDKMVRDIADLQEGQQMLQESNQRIEQRQVAEIKRKDILSIKLNNHEKRIVQLEKNPTR